MFLNDVKCCLNKDCYLDNKMMIQLYFDKLSLI